MKRNTKETRDAAKRMLSLFGSISADEKENVIAYINGIADATARLKQKEKK